jgi:very-short-patch-repair endonuclease
VNGHWNERCNVEEAQAVADAAAELMRTCPQLSLGIVSMNQPQRDLIEAELDLRYARDSALSDYQARWEDRQEDPFVKNLENVQGDERDVILISLGWGPTRQGAMHQRFSPVSRREDGHRRLNVLFTRARRRMIVFSSFDSEQITIGENTPPGVRILREYLAYARDGQLWRGSVDDRPADSPFELAVASALRARGHIVETQVGVAGYRIDLAIRHPSETMRFVCGIECDGAAYHSAKSARDRDRLRQEALERLGWRILRVWSTDWFRDAAGQAERLSDAIARLSTPPP